MKIAIYHPWPKSAEAEVAKRYILASKNLQNVEIRETATANEINEFEPDFVLSLSIYSPKAFKYPCYHVANQPIHYYTPEQEDAQYGQSRMIRGLLTHDGYLTASKEVERYIQDLAFGCNKTFICERPYANTVQATPYQEIDFANAGVAYCGTNWDKDLKGGYRFGDIFNVMMNLNAKIKFYGPEKSWDHVNSKYFGGSIPFDGKSIFEIYRKNGIGLAINRPDFFEQDLPTSRIFEIAASSALCISDRLPFVEEMFGDSVLYVDRDDAHDTAEQIIAHTDWVRKNPQLAAEKAKRANQIFNEKLALEIMIGKAIEFHKKASALQYHTKPFEFKTAPKKPKVSIVMRCGGRKAEVVARAINSIAVQSYDNIELILSMYQENEDVRALAKKFEGRFANVKVVEAFENKGLRSTPMWVGMQNITGEYFGFLDDDDEYFPNHVSTLLRGFETTKFHDNVGLVYCGSLDYRQDGVYTPKERAQIDTDRTLCDILAYDPNDSSARIERFGLINEVFLWTDRMTIPSNCWLAKAELLSDYILQDPLMKTAEDYYILLCLMQKCEIAFSCELTSQYNHLTKDVDQSANDYDRKEFANSREKIRTRLKNAPKTFEYRRDKLLSGNNTPALMGVTSEIERILKLQKRLKKRQRLSMKIIIAIILWLIVLSLVAIF